MTETELRKLAEALRERTAMKFMGDCKCGQCQLVPCEMVADSAAVIEYAAAEITALRAKVKSQAEALKPFKPISPGFDTDRPEDTVLICTRLGLCLGTIKVSDLRRAAQEAGHE